MSEVPLLSPLDKLSPAELNTEINRLEACCITLLTTVVENGAILLVEKEKHVALNLQAHNYQYQSALERNSPKGAYIALNNMHWYLTELIIFDLNSKLQAGVHDQNSEAITQLIQSVMNQK